jgi:hypothetical protein
VYRFKLQQALAECAAILIVGGFATFAGAAFTDATGRSIAPVLALGIAAIGTTIGLLALVRWRQVIYVMEGGLVYARGVVRPLIAPWAQIREVNEGGASGLRMVVRTTDGHALRITDVYEDAAELMTRVRGRARTAVVAALEREWLDEGRMTFHHPGTRAFGHAEYFTAASSVAAAGVAGWVALRQSTFVLGTLFLCALAGAMVLAIVELLRRDARWRGASVTLTPAGLCVSRIDGVAEVPWADVTGAEYVGWELLVRRDGGRAIAMPLTIANAGYLQHYIGQLRARPPTPARTDPPRAA